MLLCLLCAGGAGPGGWAGPCPDLGGSTQPALHRGLHPGDDALLRARPVPLPRHRQGHRVPGQFSLILFKGN